MSSRNAPLGIVVGIDESPSARLAVQWAAHDAELRNIPLTLVHAVSPEVSSRLKMPMPAGLARWQQDRGRRLVDEALKVVDEAAQGGGPAGVHTEILGSPAVPALVDLSKDAEMVVTGCLGSGRWPGRQLGSVSSAVLRYAHCPVVIVHDEDPSAAQRGQAPVLVGIDGSSASELATAFAFDEAARRRVGLVGLHAWSDIDVSEWPGIDWPATQSMAEQVLAERLAGWQEQYPDVAVTRIVVQDQPARQLVDKSGQAQLVVVGSRGRGGFAGMSVGSVGEAVAQLAQVPVIVARESPE
ncbi:universal stress protein [Mycobacterium kansasii]|uniref:Universal stress protein n=3 Tax=Mycobacterium kansasii TaxID=1768 RepID=A0A653ELG8_MYCKA|nr:universal stress protein [Mycobacterium kansasii]EUA00255.1 universal stress protein [Mycobacterium kansasii 824]AGZ53361.1 universal stress protein [Mycobacterium kansasii ATCC 12478]ARG55027.1 universal stress protein [Mycobacterium kansasii]ARG60479.1 universal stress protein [Mycobacterium kansasii]ARG68161.1 universal stress protein [Mycobacterium kansasii]